MYKYLSLYHRIKRPKKKKKKQNTDLTVCPCIICRFLVKRGYHFTHYTTAGFVKITLIQQKLYRAVC